MGYNGKKKRRIYSMYSNSSEKKNTNEVPKPAIDIETNSYKPKPGSVQRPSIPPTSGDK